jgi:hypothetical protein
MTEHEHAFARLREERAPTGPEPEHTKFFVFGCNCGMIRVFPYANFQLATEEYKTQFLADLYAVNCFLEDPPR